ncbi:MAG: HAMP domain-containing sensor histidine kinase, partial [Microbacterium sp.]
SLIRIPGGPASRNTGHVGGDGQTMREARGRWPSLSVRTRIVAVITIVAAIGMLGVGATVYLVERASVLQNVEDRLEANLESARFIVAEGLGGSGEWASSEEALRAVVQRMSPDDNTGAIGIVDGRIAFVPGVPLDVSLQDHPAIARDALRAVADGAPAIGTFAEDGVRWRYLAAPIEVPASTDAAGADSAVFVMAYDLAAELAEIDSTARVFLAVAAVAVVAVAAVGAVVASRLLRPLREMRETTRRISAQSLDEDERLPVHGRDDVSELAETLNDMLDRLDRALDSQRRLLSDVGHELKTPITIVRGYVEVMDADDPADVRETRGLAIDELERMGVLVRDLAGAASLYGPHPVRLRETDAGELARQIVRKAEMVEGAEVTPGRLVDAVVTLDAARITQAALQLVQNAASHGGGRVTIGTAVVGDAWELWVRDRGPGVADAMKSAVFARFHRGTDVEGRGATGSGLGLDIVRMIARAHGGDVAVYDAPGGGAVFVIAVPLGGDRGPVAPSPVESHVLEEGVLDGIRSHR